MSTDVSVTPASEKQGVKGWVIALIVGGAVILLAIAGLLVWLLSGSGHDDDPEPEQTANAVVTTSRQSQTTAWTQATTVPTTTTTWSTTTTRPTQPTGYWFSAVATDALNVRRDPSTRYDRVGMLRKGATINVVGESGDFWEISYTWQADGVYGYTAYVHKDYVSQDMSKAGVQASTVDFEYLQINGNTEVKITKYIGKGGAVTIPTTLSGKPVREIGANAFAGCSSVTSVTIPEGVRTIGSWAFWDCTSLSSITIPKTMTGIGDHAFSNCWSLSHVNFSGTQQAWSSISIGYDNDDLLNITW